MADSRGPAVEMVRDWTIGTLSFGAAGTAFGALSGFLNGQPMLFFAAAYGTNSVLISGAVLGVRAVALRTLPSNVTNDKRWVTAASAGLVGAATSAFMSGPSKAPLGLAMYGAAGWAGQYGVDAVNAWRARQAAQLAKGQGQQATGTAVVQYDAVRTAQTTSLPQAPSEDASPAPAHLRPSRAVDLSRLGPGSNTTAANDDDDSVLGPRTPWGWLPLVTDQATADARRLRKLKARLADVEETLGLTDPASKHDPRLTEVLELERKAGIRK